jgi:hypothetical protein
MIRRYLAGLVLLLAAAALVGGVAGPANASFPGWLRIGPVQGGGFVDRANGGMFDGLAFVSTSAVTFAKQHVWVWQTSAIDGPGGRKYRMLAYGTTGQCLGNDGTFLFAYGTTGQCLGNDGTFLFAEACDFLDPSQWWSTHYLPAPQPPCQPTGNPDFPVFCPPPPDGSYLILPFNKPTYAMTNVDPVLQLMPRSGMAGSTAQRFSVHPLSKPAT